MKTYRRELSCGRTTSNTQNWFEVTPKLTMFGGPARPLHIWVRRWFLTQYDVSSGVATTTGVGGAAVGVGVEVGRRAVAVWVAAAV